MCLALPALVVELRPPDNAIVEIGGVRKSISVALVPQAVTGDYVIVHVGHAIGLLDVEEAEATLALFAELARSQV
jgi:hydrogenase expression/formation protein HypC